MPAKLFSAVKVAVADVLSALQISGDRLPCATASVTDPGTTASENVNVTKDCGLPSLSVASPTPNTTLVTLGFAVSMLTVSEPPVPALPVVSVNDTT